MEVAGSDTGNFQSDKEERPVPQLRFQTDEGRRVVGLLQRATQLITEEVSALMGNVSSLVSGDWQANGAYQFQEWMTRWQRTMQHNTEQLNALANRLQEEIVQWEETAAVFGGQGSQAVAEQVFFEPLETDPSVRIPEIPSPFETLPAAASFAPSPKGEPSAVLPSGPVLPLAVENTTRWLAKQGITGTRLQSYSEVRGETVPGDDGQNKYPRYSYQKRYRSNCTWYAAAAIAAASNGRINLQNYGEKTGIRNLGPGKTWAVRAKEWVQEYERAQTPPEQRIVTGVDKTPRAGDVLANNKSHVAFVEEVRVSPDDKKIYVIVSEENAGSPDGKYIGQPVDKNNSMPITIQSDLPHPPKDAKPIRRYRRVITFDNINAGTDKPPTIAGKTDFIHFNYNYKK